MKTLYINFSEISTIFVRFLKDWRILPRYLRFSLHFTGQIFVFFAIVHHFLQILLPPPDVM